MSTSNIPTKINMFNAYLRGNKLLGMTGEVPLPDFEALSETVSGPGILGEIDDPAIGHFSSQELEITFRTLDEDIFNLMDPLDVLELTLRASMQAITAEGGTAYEGLRVVVRGKQKNLTGGKLKQASPMDSGIKIELLYILIERNGNPMVELDKLNGVFKIKGVDILAKARALC